MKEWKNVYWLFKTKSILFRFFVPLFRCETTNLQTFFKFVSIFAQNNKCMVHCCTYNLVSTDTLPSVCFICILKHQHHLHLIHSLLSIQFNALALASQCTDVMFWCVKAFIGDRISFISKTDYRIHLNKLIHKLEWIFTQIIRFYKRFKNLIRKKMHDMLWSSNDEDEEFDFEKFFSLTKK